MRLASYNHLVFLLLAVLAVVATQVHAVSDGPDVNGTQHLSSERFDDNSFATADEMPEPEIICPEYDIWCEEGELVLWRVDEHGCDVPYCSESEPESSNPQPLPPIQSDCGPEIALPCDEGYIPRVTCDENGCCHETSCVRNPYYETPCTVYVTAPLCDDGSIPPMKTVDGCDIYDIESCPELLPYCTTDLLECANGIDMMSRDPKNDCQFHQCPYVEDPCVNTTCAEGTVPSASCEAYDVDGSCIECDIHCSTITIDKQDAKKSKKEKKEKKEKNNTAAAGEAKRNIRERSVS